MCAAPFELRTRRHIPSKHSQEEWESFQETAKFKAKFIEICPDVIESDIKDKWVPHLFDFSYEYANDSGNVPSC